MKKALLLCILLIVFYALSELLLAVLDLPKDYKRHSAPPQFHRVTDKDIVYVNIPDTDITFTYDGNPRKYFDSKNNVHHHTNKDGFRGTEFSLEKATDTARVIFLGDSFTFGEGVKDSDTFSEQFKIVAEEEKIYKDKNVEVINLGVGGYNTVQEWNLLSKYAKELSPDLIVIGYVLNDAEPILFYPIGESQLGRRDRELEVPENQPSSDYPFYISFSRFIKLIAETNRQVETNKKIQNYYYSLYEDQNEEWQKVKTAIRNFGDFQKNNSVKTIAVIFPLLYQLNNNYPFLAIHEKINNEFRKNNIEVIDLYNYLKGKKEQDLWVHPTDQHPNEKVQKIAAEALVKQIKQ